MGEASIIAGARWVLGLKPGWDDADASPISVTAFNRMAEAVKAVLAAFPDVQTEPSISPITDGSLDMDWHLLDVRIAVNFQPTMPEVTWYIRPLDGLTRLEDIPRFSELDDVIQRF